MREGGGGFFLDSLSISLESIAQVNFWRHVYPSRALHTKLLNLASQPFPKLLIGQVISDL